jgi:hypothetical protein
MLILAVVFITPIGLAMAGASLLVANLRPEERRSMGVVLRQ